jgi:hypothetical protein
VLIILHQSAKLKMPSEATADVCVRRAAQSPVAAEAAPTSCPTRPRKAHVSVTLYHESMATLPGLPLRPERQFDWGWLDSPQGGPHGRGPPRVPGPDLWPLCTGIHTDGFRRSTLRVRPLARLWARLDGTDGATRAPRRRYSPRYRSTRPAWWVATPRPAPFYRRT